jgi:hypothetical protein
MGGPGELDDEAASAVEGRRRFEKLQGPSSSRREARAQAARTARRQSTGVNDPKASGTPKDDLYAPPRNLRENHEGHGGAGAGSCKDAIRKFYEELTK